MKKIFIFIISLFILIMPLKINGEEKVEIAKNSKSAILMEPSTKTILYEKNSHEKLAPASMTKMMSLIIIMENIENGNLKWNDIVVVSKNAAGMGGSQIFLEVNEMMTVEDLVKGICVASGNDATVALAEKIAGTEASFVKLMNEKVKILGLKNTNFVNSTGLDAKNHYSSAYDMAIIARELVKHERVLKFSSIYEDYLRKNTENSFWLVNTNKLVKYYSYIDGLKTGYTSDAGYCLTATGKKKGLRLISVVMGEETNEKRTSDTMAMLDYGFNMYNVTTIVDKDKPLGMVKVNLGENEQIQVYAKDNITVLNNSQKAKKNITYEIETEKIIAPVKVGDIVGKIIVYEDSRFSYEVELVVIDEIKKANILKIMIRNLKDILWLNV